MAAEELTPRKAWWTGACRVLHDSRMMGPFRSRAGRRRLAGLYLLLLAAVPLVGWLAGRLWVVLLLLIPYAVGSLLLAVATQGLLDRPLRSLDERQLDLRRSLFREPYATGASLGLAGGLVVAVATLAEPALAMGLLVAVFGLVFGLPSMVLAWRMPADLADDE
jgi:hypothetical protein